MATLTVTNLDTEPLLIQDLYVTIPVNGSVSTERTQADLQAMKSLQTAVDEGKATASLTLTAAEIGSGLGADGAPVSSTSVQSGSLTLRVSLAAGGGGSPDDTIVFAAGDMPSNYRIMDHKMFVSTAIGATTVTVESEAGGTGTQYLTISSAATGEVTDTTLTAAPLAVRSATEGLYVRRSDDGVAVELYLTVRPEL